eukprot:scaffold301658_cov30-Prasinocladus_malaysianus.AAC.1
MNYSTQQGTPSRHRPNHAPRATEASCSLAPKDDLAAIVADSASRSDNMAPRPSWEPHTRRLDFKQAVVHSKAANFVLELKAADEDLTVETSLRFLRMGFAGPRRASPSWHSSGSCGNTTQLAC